MNIKREIIRHYIKEAVENLVNSGKMFSAYDVTRQIQKHGIDVRHTDLRETIHNYLFNGNLPENWLRTLVYKHEIRNSFFLYHYTDQNPDSYEIVAQPVREFSVGLFQ